MNKIDDDGTTHTAPPASTSPHQLFPPLFPHRDEPYVEPRDGVLVTFQRRRSDGQFEHCPQDFAVAEVQSWMDVMRRWGGGEYRAIGKNGRHQIVALCPPRGWQTLEGASTQFTFPDGTLYGLPIDATATDPATPPSAATPPIPDFLDDVCSRFELALVELISAQSVFERAKVTEMRKRRAFQAGPPAWKRAIDLLHAFCDHMISAPVGRALVDLLGAQSGLALAMATTARTVRWLHGREETPLVLVSFAHRHLAAMSKWMPTQEVHASVSDSLSQYKAISELMTSATPGPTDLGEFKELLMTLVHRDAARMAACDASTPAKPNKRGPSPRRRADRRRSRAARRHRSR